MHDHHNVSHRRCLVAQKIGAKKGPGGTRRSPDGVRRRCQLTAQCDGLRLAAESWSHCYSFGVTGCCDFLVRVSIKSIFHLVFFSPSPQPLLFTLLSAHHSPLTLPPFSSSFRSTLLILLQFPSPRNGFLLSHPQRNNRSLRR